jgi:non-canonical (house-cleaning) NTP pyrophosphatase
MRIALVVLCTAAAACGHHRGSTAPQPAGEIALQVINHHWLDVTVYVVHNGERTRIGLVTAATSQTFMLPARIVGQAREISLLGEALGSRDIARTETLVVKAGQTIEWTLESDLRRSSVGVY